MSTRAVKRKKAAATAVVPDGDGGEVELAGEEGAAASIVADAAAAAAATDDAVDDAPLLPVLPAEADDSGLPPKRTRTSGKSGDGDGTAVEGASSSDVAADAAEAVKQEDTTAAGAASLPLPRPVKKSLSSRVNSAFVVKTEFPSHLNPTNPADFDHFLFQLLACRAESNTPNFTVHKEDFPLLHAWMQFLRKEYKTYTNGNLDGGDGQPSQLTAQQVMVLESLHVPLTSRGNDHWNRHYELLADYKTRHGHVLVPRMCEVPGLGDWVTDQRRQYKAKQQGRTTQLSEERQLKLDELEFVWHVRNRPEWDIRFAELLAYKAQNGDCKVPQHYKTNKALGKWVAKQREQYKLLRKEQHSFLTPYRQEKLNSAGFSWMVRSGIESSIMKTTDEDLKLEDSTLLAQVNGDGVEGASNLKVEDDSNAVEATVVTEENDASAGVETKGQGEDPETMGLAMMDVDEATAKTTDVTVTMV